MKKIIYFTIFILPITLFSQKNLVPNFSFELLNNCPNSFLYFPVQNWFSANNGTPDVFNTCDYKGSNDVPYSSFGYQIPKSGNGYVGIYTYQYYKPNELTEYIETKLKNKLKINRLHYISFYVSLTGFSPCYTDAISLTLSKKIELDSNKTIRERHKAIIHQKGQIIKDTSNWTKISGIYTGNDEEYLIIGNFFQDKDVDRKSVV